MPALDLVPKSPPFLAHEVFTALLAPLLVFDDAGDEWNVPVRPLLVPRALWLLLGHDGEVIGEIVWVALSLALLLLLAAMSHEFKARPESGALLEATLLIVVPLRCLTLDMPNEFELLIAALLFDLLPPLPLAVGMGDWGELEVEIGAVWAGAHLVALFLDASKVELELLLLRTAGPDIN